MVHHSNDPISEPSRILTLLPFRSPASPKSKGNPLFRKASSALQKPVHISRNRRSHVNESLNPKPVPTKATFQWVKGDLLGKGSYAKVYLGLNANTGEIMAVKQVELPQTPTDLANSRHQEIAEALKFEQKTLMQLAHPNIVQYLGYEESPNYLSIFLEYVPGGTILSCLQNHGVFCEEVSKSFTRQILVGLCYLHEKGIIHRDLKSDNILVEPSGICKISDFGISKQVENISQARAYTGLKGTIYWMAPEMLDNGEGRGYDAKVDIWSIGCVVLEMWTGERPWPGEEIFPVMMKLSQEKLPPPIPARLILTDQAHDFRRQCFQSEPRNRPSAANLQKHQYLELPANWRFEGFGPSSNASKVTPALSPISTVIGNATYRQISQPDQIETLRPTPQDYPIESQQVSGDGPQVVFIEPLYSPPSQIAHLPNNVSRTSLDTAGSVSTLRKGFRVMNPDDHEQQANKQPFVYHPPPLPSVDHASPYSSRLLPVATQSAEETYPPSLRERVSSRLSRRNGSLDHSSHRRTHSSQAFSDYAESQNDDEIWAVRPADLINDSGRGQRARSTSRTRGPSVVGGREEWLRPVPATVYENLQGFFPRHYLEKDVVPVTPEPRGGQGKKKSVLVVAADRAQSGERRRTMLWDSKVEELL